MGHLRPCFTLADADNEAKSPTSPTSTTPSVASSPSGCHQNRPASWLTPPQPIQADPTKPGYNPVVCSSLDIWADYQTPGLTPITGRNGASRADALGELAGNFQQLAELKAKYPELKVIMSLGGYNGSAFFSAAAATDGRPPGVRLVVHQHVHQGRPGRPAGQHTGPTGHRSAQPVPGRRDGRRYF